MKRVVNINEQVTFKMSAAGEALWREHIRTLRLSVADYVMDEYTWPLFEVMSFFGPHIQFGTPSLLFEGNNLHLCDE